MHVFVTGGTGFFGRALLQYWATSYSPLKDARFTLLSRDPARFRTQYGALLAPLDVEMVAGDIQQPDSLPKCTDFTHILHGATDSTHGLALSPLHRYEQIVDGTQNVLELARRNGAARVLLLSSGGVYGPQPTDLSAIPEDYTGMPDPLNPENAYSVAKRTAEHLAALYHQAHGVESVIARCFSFVGPDLPRDAHFAIGNFIRDVMAKREIVIKGDGTPLRSFLHQHDLAVWLTTILLHGHVMRAYNVGSDEVITIADLARLVSLLGGASSEVTILGEKPLGQAALRNLYIPDISLARAQLGLAVTIPLDRAIKMTIQTLGSGPIDCSQAS